MRHATAISATLLLLCGCASAPKGNVAGVVAGPQVSADRVGLIEEAVINLSRKLDMQSTEIRRAGTNAAMITPQFIIDAWLPWRVTADELDDIEDAWSAPPPELRKILRAVRRSGGMIRLRGWGK